MNTPSHDLAIPLGLYAPSFGEIAARGRSQVAQAHPRVAIIVDDGGYGGESAETILGLDPALTFAVLPNTPHGTALAEEAARRGLEKDESGGYRFRIVLVLVARQNGKTHLLRTISAWKMRRSKILVVGVAQDLATAREAASYGVLVNAIAPGFIDTPLLADLTENAKRMVSLKTPLGRLGTVDEIAETAVYLAGPASTFVTGQTVSPNGGIYMSQ